MKNEGKKFEEDFQKSCNNQGYFIYRLRDGTGNIGGQNENLRFQATNICDFTLWGHNNKNMYWLELKTTKQKSIPFSMVRDKQVRGLEKIADYDGLTAGFIFNFRTAEKTFFVSSFNIKSYMEYAQRKSFPLEWVEQHGKLIKQKKKRVRYSYDIKRFIED